ncbi:catenin delta-2-like, partial [Actinia tenebrosa]|uniref:Catenin delta-2-like n=1 Tax=Actinia tenebrosa TaxID=6105 RepID=A0A6P8H2B5_ACTTE
MASRRREYSEDSAANLLRSVRQQEHQFQKLTQELEEERKSVALQLQRCNYNPETASVSSMGSSTDESFVWRGQGPGSATDERDFTDDESCMSGSALVDSCLKVLQERGINDSRDDQDPLYSKNSRMEPTNVTGQSNTLVSPDWEKELMDADLTPGSHAGQTVKKVVTRTEVRTVRTVDGQIIEDQYDPGTERMRIERYGYGKTVNGDGPSTPRKSSGSQSSVDDYRSPRGYGARGGYSSADEGIRTPATNGPSGYMSDSYATPSAGPRTPSQGSVQNEPQYVRTAVQTTSMSLPRTHAPSPGPRGPGTATMPRTSSSGRPT